MKPVALILLTFVLAFRAAALCAAPVAVAAPAAMADCADMPGDHHGNRDGQAPDASLACQLCTPLLAMAPAIAAPVLWFAPRPDSAPAFHMASAVIEPPTPPPRAAAFKRISTF